MTTPADAYARVEELAKWTPWLPFADAAGTATRMPGVYLLRLPESKQIVYVGMAGERSGQGIWGRTSIYRSGKGAASGFGEAAFDRALADEEFVVGQLNRLRGGHFHVGARRYGQTCGGESANLAVTEISTMLLDHPRKRDAVARISG